MELKVLSSLRQARVREGKTKQKNRNAALHYSSVSIIKSTLFALIRVASNRTLSYTLSSPLPAPHPPPAHLFFSHTVAQVAEDKVPHWPSAVKVERFCGGWSFSAALTTHGIPFISPVCCCFNQDLIGLVQAERLVGGGVGVS